MVKRLGYDLDHFLRERKKLNKPDGVHCIICNTKFEKPDKRKSYCSEDCYLDWYNSLNIKSWTITRSNVIERDGKCLDCGIEEENFVYDINKPRDGFEVHHIIPICEGGDEFDMDNLMTLCVDCHIQKHSKIGKKKLLNKSLTAYI